MSETIILELIKTALTVATTIIAGVISIKLGKLHRQINSRMDQLLSESKKSAHAEGKVEEKHEEEIRKQNI